MKKILDILKEYWNLYSPFIISSIASWLVDWNANQMVTINQWIGVTLSLMALFTMIKFLIFPKKKKNAVEKLVSSQKVVKNAEMIINQEEKIKEKIKAPLKKVICEILFSKTLLTLSDKNLKIGIFLSLFEVFIKVKDFLKVLLKLKIFLKFDKSLSRENNIG